MVKALTLEELSSRVNAWAETQQVTILDTVSSSQARIRFRVIGGDYVGCEGSRVAHTMRIGRSGVDWKSFTKESKARFITSLFSTEGFRVTALPISLSVVDKIVCERVADKQRWEVTLINFMAGKRPRDANKASKGEQTIEAILLYNNIAYKKEYPVTIHGKLMRYDFFIPEKNLYIEYNGKQHYESHGMFAKAMSIETRKQYDRWKTEYATTKGELLVIPYIYTSVEDIKDKLSGFLHVKLPTKQYLNEYTAGRLHLDVRIAEYYKNHSCKETCRHFKVSSQTVQRAFKQVNNCNRQAFRRGRDDLDTQLEYYRTHSQLEIKKKYHSSGFLDKKFIEKYGMTKREYINKQNAQRYKEAVEYFKTHSIKETTEKYNVSASKVYVSFREIYGKSKTAYLKERE